MGKKLSVGEIEGSCFGGSDDRIRLEKAVVDVEGFSRVGGVDMAHGVKPDTSEWVGSISVGVRDGVVVEIT